MGLTHSSGPAVPTDEIGVVLLARVTDRSWRRRTDGITPPEYAPALFGLDDAVCRALAADWTADEIVDEVRQLVESRTPDKEQRQ